MKQNSLFWFFFLPRRQFRFARRRSSWVTKPRHTLTRSICGRFKPSQTDENRKISGWLLPLEIIIEHIISFLALNRLKLKYYFSKRKLLTIQFSACINISQLTSFCWLPLNFSGKSLETVERGSSDEILLNSIQWKTSKIKFSTKFFLHFSFNSIQLDKLFNFSSMFLFAVLGEIKTICLLKRCFGFFH